MAHTAVDHGLRNSMLTGQYADRCATGQEIAHHLPGHVAGVCRHTAPDDAVIGGADQQLGGLQRGRLAAENHAQLVSQPLQPPQSPQRFSLVINLVLQARRQCSIMNVFNFRKFKRHD